MITMEGICSLCTDNKIKRLSKRYPPLCCYHYSAIQREKSLENKKTTKIQKPLKRSKLSYVRKPTGEKKLFEEMWNSTNEHKSFINGDNIPFFDLSCFAHVLPKGQIKKILSLLPENNITFGIMVYVPNWLTSRNGIRCLNLNPN